MTFSECTLENTPTTESEQFYTDIENLLAQGGKCAGASLPSPRTVRACVCDACACKKSPSPWPRARGPSFSDITKANTSSTRVASMSVRS